MTFGFQTTAEQVTEGRNLSGQTWLITGVNSGLGYETARVLALRGAQIVGLARTENKAAEALDGLGIEGVAVAADLADLDTVRAAVGTIKGLGSLNGIIANAGIMALPELVQRAGLELQFLTNHVGHFALITPILDKLTADGRVVMLSSGAHFMAKRGLELDNLSGSHEYHPWRMYGRSKLANILYARSLARRFTGSKRTANAVHPGVIRTNLGRHVPNADAMYESLDATLKTVEQGAATQCYVATHPRLNAISGKYFADCKVARTLDAAEDEELAEVLWNRTVELVGSTP